MIRECWSHWGISLVSVGSKLLSNMMLFRLIDAVDKFLREEHCGFRKGRRCVDHIFTFSLIIEKCLSCQPPLVLSFIDYEQVFNSLYSTGKTIWDHRIKWGGKTLLDLDYVDYLCILNGSVSKMNQRLEVCDFRVLE